MKYHLQRDCRQGTCIPENTEKEFFLFVYSFLIGSDSFFLSIYFTVVNHGDFFSDKTEPFNCKLASCLL